MLHPTRIALALLTLIFASCSGQPTPKASQREARSLPEALEVETLDWSALAAALDAPKASYTVVNLWATWCPPCVAELPDLQEAAKTIFEDGSEVVTISMDLSVPAGPIDEAGIRAFFEKRDLVLPVWIFDGDANELVTRLQWGGSLPYTAVLDENGQVLAGHEGGMTKGEFLELYRSAIDQ
ncbi:MAG: TlpA disulfide reductase family protein [Planctomycetota bacterium]